MSLSLVRTSVCVIRSASPVWISFTRTSQRDQNPVVRIAVGVRFQREGLHDHQRILIVVGLARFVLVRLLRCQRSIQIDDHLPARRRSDVTLAEIHLRLADDILREKDLHARDPDVVEGRLGRLFHIEAQRSEQMLEGNRAAGPTRSDDPVVSARIRL